MYSLEGMEGSCFPPDNHPVDLPLHSFQGHLPHSLIKFPQIQVTPFLLPCINQYAQHPRLCQDTSQQKTALEMSVSLPSVSS